MFDLDRGGRRLSTVYSETGVSEPPRALFLRSRQHDVRLERVAALGLTCAALLLAVAGCGTPPMMGPADPPPSASPSVARVEVKPQSISLGLQDTVDLKATALDEQGNPIPDASISWSVTDTSVVSLNNNGKAKGKKAGSTTISASSGGKTGHSKVNVKKGGSTVTLTLMPQADTLAPSGSVQLDAEVTDGAGQPISGVTFNWSSSATSVATVDSGLVTAQSTGSATITAEVQGLTADASITVMKPSSQSTVASVRVQPSADTVQVGSSVQLTATPLDANGKTISGASVTWSSSATSVATVDGSGKVSGIAQGSATITATAGGQSGKASITVIPDPPASSSPSGLLAAFPGAQGYGATALSQCDRSSVQVLRVTNLQDSGLGSLRNAIAQVDNNRLSVIVFTVGGYIHLSSEIRLNSTACLYIAGQTAPGGGIVIQRAPGKGLFFRYNTHDIVIRYLRFLGGYAGDYKGHVNILVGSGQNIVLDHLSLGWTTDKLLIIEKYVDMDWSGVVSNITLQRSLLHEPFAFHPTALQISSNDRVNAPIKNIDVHDNLFANNDHRSPDGITSGLKVVNNVIYNWQQGASMGEEKAVTDWVGNYYKIGPMTDRRYTYEVTFQENTIGAAPSYYVLGNVGPHNSDPYAGQDAQWNGSNRVVACYYKCAGYGDGTPGQPLPDSARRDTPLPAATIPIKVELATEAYKSVLNDVGANARLACNGDWVPNSDAVDQRIISEVTNGTGPNTTPVTEADVGGFPSIAAGTACADADKDGMPDDFEIRYGLDPHNAADASQDANGDGYTNLEEFLNGRSPR